MERKAQAAPRETLEEKPAEETDKALETKKDYQQSPEETALTTHVSGLTKGEPKVNHEKNETTVNEQPINNVFAQTANPDPEAISMVDAKIEVIPPEMQLPAANNADYNTHKLDGTQNYV